MFTWSSSGKTIHYSLVSPSMFCLLAEGDHKLMNSMESIVYRKDIFFVYRPLGSCWVQGALRNHNKFAGIAFEAGEVKVFVSRVAEMPKDAGGSKEDK